MKNSLNPREKTLLYGDLYSWVTLALSHPQNDSSIEETLEILNEINSLLQINSDIDISKELEELKSDNRIRSINLLFMQQEHSRLFIGPFSLLAPPYESYYRDNHSLMGKVSSDVEMFYQYAGMEISSSFKDAPDHIIIETEFLAKLCEIECSALEKKQYEQAAASRALQLSFLQKHLLAWIFALQSVLEKEAQSSYYPVIVKILSKAASKHCQTLQENGFNSN